MHCIQIRTFVVPRGLIPNLDEHLDSPTVAASTSQNLSPLSLDTSKTDAIKLFLDLAETVAPQQQIRRNVQASIR